MKLLLLAALVASGVYGAWDSAHDDISKLNIQHAGQYRYRYESQLMTGLPTFSRQYAGLKVTADVKITFTTPCRLELSNVRVYSLNKELQQQHQLPPTMQISIDQFTPLPSVDSHLILQKLQLPIQFGYEDRKVNNIDICKDEEMNWSIDMKRSILSMLQVRLQADDFTVTQKLPYNYLKKEDVTSFDVLEAAPEGTCYSSLHVYASDKSKFLYKVIKARDYSRCIKMNVIDKHTYPQRQTNCDCSNNLHKGTCQCSSVTNTWNTSNIVYDKVATTYDLVSHDAKNFVISKAVQSVEYRVEMPQHPNQYIMTCSNQTLVLTAQTDDSPVKPHECTFITIKEPWRMHILAPEQEKPMISGTQLMSKIRKLLQELKDISTKPERFEDHSFVFYQLTDNLRWCTPQQLKDIFDECRKMDPHVKSKEWKGLLDALRTVNTTHTDELLLTKIVSGEIPNLDAMSIFMFWTSDKVPTTTILDVMHTSVLPSLQSNQARKPVFNFAMLCFGSMVRRYIHSEEIKISQCVLPNDKAFHQRNIDSCRKYEKYVEGRLSVARTDEEKIMVLKTVANIGSIKTLPMLQNLLVDSESTAVRVHAIWAFKNLGIRNKLQVLQSLLPIMLHHHADSELRIAAFVMVMKCNPSTALLEIQKHLNDLHDLEFKSFVVKCLRNMLENHQPNCIRCDTRIRQVLKSIRAFPMSEATTDFQIKYGLKNAERNGDMFRLSTIANKTSSVPRSVSLQRYTGWNNEWNHFVEVGFRAEGLEQLVAKLAEKSPHNVHSSILKNLVRPGNMPSTVGKPSLTLYLRVLGQQVAFFHLDETAMSSMLLAGIKNGRLKIPLTVFNTVMLTPKRSLMLQPSGTWLCTELHHLVVIDLDGDLIFDMPAGQMPVITFETNKPIRTELKTIVTQKFHAGFTVGGFTTSMGTTQYVKSGKTKIHYDSLTNQLSINCTSADPSKNRGVWNVLARSATFILPLRLPEIYPTTDKICRELKVDDSERRQYTHDIEAVKSVELNAKLELDVNMPELYTFARDRLMILPTTLSIWRQHARLTVRAVPSSRRTYCMVAGSRYFVPKEEDNEKHSESQKSVSSEPDSFFTWWPSKDSSKESSEHSSHETTTKSEFFEPRSLGSLCHRYAFSLASISDHKTLNWTTNITTYYEHDYPKTHSIWSTRRPPIRGVEREDMQFTNHVYINVNTGRNQIVRKDKMVWGRVSKPDTSITLISTFTPKYKDNVCNEQTAYGCKDSYGVIYPIWYKNTMRVEYKNTWIPEWLRDTIKPYLYNIAESVYMYSRKPSPRTANIMEFDFLVRPYENKIDYLFHGKTFDTNITRVYAPMETKLTDYIFNRHYPVGDMSVSSDSNLLPIHHRMGPFANKKDFCVYQNPRMQTFDNKRLMMPATDCEVILFADCKNQNLTVSVVPTLQYNKPKMVNVKMARHTIRMEHVESCSCMEVYINGRKEKMNKQGELSVRDRHGDEITLIRCDDKRCEMLCTRYGFLINFTHARVSVEVDSERSDRFCGVCEKRSGLPDRPSKAKSLEILKKNLISGDKCTIKDHVSLAGYNSKSTCSLIDVHKMVNYAKGSEMMKCVTCEAVKICNNWCRQQKRRVMEDVQCNCVTNAEAAKMNLRPKMIGGEMVVEDRTVLNKLSTKEKMKVRMYVYTQCR